MVIKP